MTTDNWISVKDRLPEYDKAVLWYFGNNQYLISEIYDECDNCHVLGGYHEDANMVLSPATHWQPLPEPPKEKQQNNK